jgi:hypothetical protein
MLAEGLVALLLADTPTVAILGTPAARGAEEPDGVDTSGIFSGQMPEGAALPAIVYFDVHQDSTMTMDGPDTFTIGRMQFSCFGENYADAKHLARAVRRALEAFQGTLADGTEVDSIRRVSELDAFEEGPAAYMTPVDFEIAYRDVGR